MRTIFYCFIAALALVLVFAEPVSAQVQSRVDVVAVPDRFKSGNGNEPTHGIANVGVGARVVLKPYVVYGTAIDANAVHGLTANSATWTFLSVPVGSARVSGDIIDTAAALTSGLVVYFKPDVAGSYTVQMVAVTDSGNGTSTIVITAANFKGAGAYQLGTSDYTSFNCSPCHSQASGVFSTYSKTKHASAFARRVSEEGGHFSGSCMRCHTASTAGFGLNNGYDDQATAMGFVLPAHNGTGVYDSLLQVAKDSLAAGNDSLMNVLSVAGIQCESCHGPAGEHVQSGNPALMSKEHSSDQCAPCHFSSDRHPKGYSWENSLHAISMGEGPTEPQYMNRSSCSMCHVGQGFVNETIKGNVAPTSGYAKPASIGCVTCHDPHSNEGAEFQLYRKTSRDACTGCHTNRISSRGLHHSHQGTLVVGVDAIPMNPTLNKAGVGNYSGWQLPGYRYSNGTHSEIEERCVKCHMAPSPDYDPSYASPDTLLNIVGGHTWRVSWTDINGTHVNNNGCSGAECHGGTVADVTAFVEVSQAGVQVLLDSLKANLPWRSPTASPSPNEPKFPTEAGLTTVQAAASYNYWFILNDGSFGVHNPTYARQLLQSSLEQLKLGAGAAQIASIMDIPNDQGHRVQVVWNKFPAEDYAYNSVINYGIFREDVKLGGAKVIPVKNYTEMLQTAVVGQKYSVAGMIWSFVATVPATNLAQYSYVAETMKDSTATDTSKTVFYIAGYSKDNEIVYSSQPFAGRSIDNLPPLRVLNFGVTVSPSGATLSWDSNTDDKDVVKYIVYRGTTPTFVPGTALAEVTSSQYLDASATGTTPYWYIVKGVDQAGNIGAPSNAAGTTNVEAIGGVPTEYALGQNYPNPFNPSTTINFSLPEEASVILQVYTISGELVSNIAQGEFPAGNFKATWNGKDSRGTTVATGMYIYRINAGKYSAVKKMVLMK